MNQKLIKTIASVGLFTGGIFGIMGSFVSSTSLRSLAWALDGVGLILASGLLTVYYFRKGYDTLAAGFLIFAIGEGLILSSNTANLNENVSSFCAGTSLWTASLALISFQNVFPVLVRLTGFIAAVLFSIVSVQFFTGGSVNALTEPLPFYAYPFLPQPFLVGDGNYQEKILDSEELPSARDPTPEPVQHPCMGNDPVSKYDNHNLSRYFGIDTIGHTR